VDGNNQEIKQAKQRSPGFDQLPGSSNSLVLCNLVCGQGKDSQGYKRKTNIIDKQHNCLNLPAGIKNAQRN
jgi:hypothetical protein